MELLKKRNAVFVAAVLALFAVVQNGTAAQEVRFRNIGPLDGRLDAASGVAGDPKTYYVGGLGGLFKTSDGGITWGPAFDGEPVSSVSAIAVAASRPATVYIGTGEANLRNDVAFGDGVWRSTDAGKTWQHAGLEATGHIAAIAVDPVDANRVYIAALGDVYKPSGERGIYRTTDGGKTWQKVLYTDERTGGSSIAIDPSNPKHLLAGMWEGWRNPYHLTSGGPNDGLYESADGGDHWSRLRGNGLPAGITGRIAVAFAPSHARRVYALIESAHGVLWRSDDGGNAWKMVNASHGIDQRPFYFTSLAIDPADENRVYFMSVDIWQTGDGGKTVKAAKRPQAGFGDDHQMWIDPRDPARMIVVGDDGAAISQSEGNAWAWQLIPVAQPYHVDTDDRIPYTICSEDQDAGSACGPSNSLETQGISPGEFFDAGGGESGWILFDRRQPDVVYAAGYEGSLTRYDRRSKQARRIDVWPEDPMGRSAAQLLYRFQWTAPIAMASHRSHRLYMGGNKIFQTDDGGTTWTPISPDLTRNDKSRQQISGTPVTPDNTSVEYYDVVFCIGPSPQHDAEIWAGTDDGRVWLTRDEGKHWRNVTPQTFGRVPDRHWLRVDYVAPSPFDAATAYVAADAHKWGDRRPHLFVTHDYGTSWTVISGALPQDGYTRMIRPDPVRRGMLYAGTETGLYYSYDEGKHWTHLTSGLPVVPVYDFEVQKRFDDLVVATHGRGIWILDDLRPLQEMTDAVRSRPLHLFTLRDAYRYRLTSSESESAFRGENPKYGADINVWLASAPSKLRVQILDGIHVIRTIDLEHPVAGINRIWWNLRYDALDPVKGYAPWRDGGFQGPLAPPGFYTVRVTANGAAARGTVRVEPDPRSRIAPAALREQLAFLLRIRSDLASVNDAIVRAQAIVAAGGANSESADRILHELYNPQAGQSEDALRTPDRVYEQLSALASDAGSSDAAPTPAEYQVLRVLEKHMREVLTRARVL